MSPAATPVLSLAVRGEIGQVGAPCDAAPAWYADRVCTMHRTVNVGAGKNTSLDPFTLAREMAADPSIDEDQFRGMVSDFLVLLLVPVVVHTAKNGDVLESGMRLPTLARMCSMMSSRPPEVVRRDAVASIRDFVTSVMLRCREVGEVPTTLDALLDEMQCGSRPHSHRGRARTAHSHATVHRGTSPSSARGCSTSTTATDRGRLYRAATRDVDDSRPPGRHDRGHARPRVHERVRLSVVHLKNLDERRRAVVVRHVLMLLTLRIADFASRTGSTQHRPRVALVIDEVGKLCPRTEDSGGMMARMLADFLKLNRKHGIVLIMATQDVGSLDPSVLKALGGPTILGYQGTRDAWKRLVSARYGGKKGIQDPVCARIVDAVTGVDRARHQFVRLPSRTEEEQIFTFDVPHHPHLDAGAMGALDESHPIVRTDAARRAKRQRVA